MRGLIPFALALAAGTAAWGAPASGGRDPGDEYVLRRWTTEDGLPHNVVNRVEQDPAGYLWLGTVAGLARFDGRQFEAIRLPDPNGSLARNIRSLGLLPDGSVVFVPASGGVWRWKDGKLDRYPLPPDIARENLLEMHVEPGGALWLGVPGGCVRLENGQVKRFGAPEGIARRLLPLTFATDSGGRTWIAGAGFLKYFDAGELVSVAEVARDNYIVAPARSGGVWVFAEGLFKWEDGRLMSVAPMPWKSGRASASCMYEDGRGVLWLGSSHEGAYWFDGREFHRVVGIPDAVHDIAEDREANLWLATNSGLRRLRRRIFTWIGGSITNVAEDASGTLWMAAGADGVIRRRGEDTERFPLEWAHAPLHATVVAPDTTGNLWVGSSTGIYETPTSAPGPLRRVDASLAHVRLLWCDPAGRMWAAGVRTLGYFRDGSFVSLEDRLPQPVDITAFAESAPGHFWFGTAHGEVFSVAADADPQVGSLSRTVGGTVTAISTDGAHRMWLATASGLVFLDHDRARRFTRDNGLPDDFVIQLLRDGAGNLWFGTPQGMYRLDRSEVAAAEAGTASTLTPVNYGPEQGIVGLSPMSNYQPSAWRDRAGRLWFCTFQGVMGLDPRTLVTRSPPVPLVIEDVELNGKPLAAGPRILVPPGEQHLEVQFAALSFSAPECVHLRHQLVGFDSDWVDTPADRSARYSKLPPGRYALRVTACNSEGVWNASELGLAVTVLPAWWQTVWFRVGAVCLVTLAGGLAVRFWSQRKLRARLERLEREHALEKERARIARDLHDDLGSGLSGINFAVQRLQTCAPDEVPAMLELLDRRVRRLTLELDRFVWTASPSNGTLDKLADFVEHFAQQVFAGSGIRCRVSGVGGMPPVPLTPDCQHHVLAMTKEMLNNVLKHSRASEVRIAMTYEGGRFSLSVRDDGVGFAVAEQERSRRNGLKNIRARGAEIGGAVDIRSAPGSGTEVSLGIHVT